MERLAKLLLSLGSRGISLATIGVSCFVVMGFWWQQQSSNQEFESVQIAKAGGKSIMVKSGHSLIKGKMQEVDAQLAGEFSGHFFIKAR